MALFSAQDLRFAFRSLQTRPGLSAVIIATLGLGIGATTATFSLLDATLLRPLPFERADRLVFLWGVAGPERSQRGASPPEVADWRTQNHSLTGVSAYDPFSLNLRTERGPERLNGERVNPDYFRLLGVHASQGRTFTAEEDRVADAFPVVLVSHSAWRTRFGADSGLVGRTIILNDRPFTVVGIMPEGFSGLSFQAELWIPLAMLTVDSPAGLLTSRNNRWLLAVARLKDGVSMADAEQDLGQVALRLAEQHPETNTDRSVDVLSLQENLLGNTASLFQTLFKAVLLVLLIACANIGNLLIARAIARKREIAIRLAIGATRPQIVRQLLVESILLAGIGGSLGVLAAVWVLEGLKAYAVSSLPRVAEISIDLRVLAFTFVSSSIAGLVFGLAPALHATRKEAQSALRGASPQGAAPVSSWGRKSLVVAETAAAVLLLIGAGLFIRSFVRLTKVDPGFVPAHALVFSAELPRARQGNDALVHTYFETALDGLRQTPGVVAAGATHVLPFSGNNSVRPFIREDQSAMRAEDAPATAYRLITPGYFKAMGIPLRGREFTATDTPTSDGVAIINESFVRQFFRDEDPIGKRIRQAGTNPQIRWLTIVGVAGDVRHDGYASEPAPEMYWPHAQATWGETLRQIRRRMSVVVRTDGTATDSTGRVRAAMARIDPGQPVADLRPLTRFVEGTVNTRRLITVLLILFACVALALALAGTYGIVSYLTLQRSREWAIRLALGAAPQQIRGSVLRLGLGLGAAGAVIGLAGALAAGRLVEDLLFGVRHTDVLTLSIAPVLMLVTAFIACLAPARRAATADPARSLKAE